jgi:hypothetical protein
MATAAAGPEIERLISLLARLPGLGPRSARRAALFLIKKRDQIMAPLATAIQTALEKIEVCRVCGNIDTQNPNPKWPGMYRVRRTDGSLSDMVSLTRAKDALVELWRRRP